MNFTKPIIYLDVETTGVEIATSRIVELSVIKIEDGKRLSKTILMNPQVPIPKESSDVHGIKDEDVSDKHTFKEFSVSLHAFLKDSTLVAYNGIKFDIPILREEFLRSGIDFPTMETTIIDPMVIFMKKNRRDLAAALKFFCDEDHEDAHSAKADTEALEKIFVAQNELYDDIGETEEEIGKFCDDRNRLDFSGCFEKNENGEILYSFGKHKGKPVKNHKSYLGYMMGNPGFTLDTKRYIREFLK